jgi:hypothetical protein
VVNVIINNRKLEEYGFYEEVEDKWFQMYLAEMSKYEIIQQIEFTDKQKEMLEEASKLAVEKILKEMNQNDNEVALQLHPQTPKQPIRTVPYTIYFSSFVSFFLVHY